MPVYVDPPLEWPRSDQWPYGSVSHLYADTPEELHAFAARLKMSRAWCSDCTQPGSRLLHYDLSPGKRNLAVRLGARSVPQEHGRAYYRSAEERQAEIESARRLRGSSAAERLPEPESPEEPVTPAEPVPGTQLLLFPEDG